MGGGGGGGLSSGTKHKDSEACRLSGMFHIRVNAVLYSYKCEHCFFFFRQRNLCIWNVEHKNQGTNEKSKINTLMHMYMYGVSMCACAGDRVNPRCRPHRSKCCGMNCRGKSRQYFPSRCHFRFRFSFSLSSRYILIASFAIPIDNVFLIVWFAWCRFCEEQRRRKKNYVRMTECQFESLTLTPRLAIASLSNCTTSLPTTPEQLKPLVHWTSNPFVKPSCCSGNENVKPNGNRSEYTLCSCR